MSSREEVIQNLSPHVDELSNLTNNIDSIDDRLREQEAQARFSFDANEKEGFKVKLRNNYSSLVKYPNGVPTSEFASENFETEQLVKTLSSNSSD